MVVLALFSLNTPVAEKKLLGDTLKQIESVSGDSKEQPQKRYGKGFGKPDFPKNISSNTRLADFANEDSWYTMRLLEIDDSFMQYEVLEWSSKISYLKAQEVASSLNVINDCAERGVKLSTDYLAAAKSEKHYPNVLQVVEQSRKKMPNLRKSN